MLKRLSRLVAAGALDPLHLHFAELVCRLHGKPDDGLALAACLVSAHTGAGHTCLPLSLVAGRPVLADEPELAAPALEPWLAALTDCAVIGRPDGPPAPLVLDAGHRLYLHRYWQYERRLAKALRERVATTDLPAAQPVRAALDRLFPASGPAPDWQKIAAAVALAKRFCVVSGGPGTGKTSTVVKILAALLEIEGPQLRIALAAPTGKAAARLRESILAAKAQLPLEDSLRERIPDGASTVHRLLGVRRGSPYFRHDADNPLQLDCLVLDEASMVDLALMTKLLDALPPTARLIVLGDKDQLASVEAGAVLGEICREAANAFSPALCGWLGEAAGVELAPTGAGGLADAVVLLQRSYRFGADSGIGALARAVNAGDGTAADAVLDDPARPDVARHPGSEWLSPDFAEELKTWFRGLLTPDDPAQALSRLNELRLLCALREGPAGVRAVNAAVEALLREAGLIRGGQWYAGRPVMISRNDYNLRLFNGDVGLALPDPAADGRLRVWFQSPEGELLRVAPNRLPEHETVFAMTVHKTQGSEFDRVLLLLPERPTPLLTRELIYTGITRGRHGVRLWDPAGLLAEGVRARVERYSGLGAALGEP